VILQANRRLENPDRVGHSCKALLYSDARRFADCFSRAVTARSIRATASVHLPPAFASIGASRGQRGSLRLRQRLHPLLKLSAGVWSGRVSETPYCCWLATASAPSLEASMS